mmetsp:Transcript_51342/g.159160  ORF Transcript_51342/g.159160 Transcript_51342/m.159160 type:complete len:321 (-) Transcript_51342:92-1054(-)|eukprot:CAMPEP_0204588964 /NCGR_PEP_ID=MMETSP0661-20131031/48923_1 /ASSEMBLY_ACC=CAM_ASM_000606 /TAXON_ID=109239 /ORGANISM="Alexandrium margalefi, Strain AMGDE01CS-322" /LENGTH=320 /DNA_ID=CAMNT_0051598831 /DNA_START=29 /DNA_END=991 /DNA_ORIENTATION=+
MPVIAQPPGPEDTSDSAGEDDCDDDAPRRPTCVGKARVCCWLVTQPAGRCLGKCLGFGTSPGLPEDCPPWGREELLHRLGKLARLVYGQGYVDDEYFGKADPPFNGEGWVVTDQIVQTAGSGNAVQAACYVPAAGKPNVVAVAFRGTSSRKGAKQCVDLRFIAGLSIRRAVREACSFCQKARAEHPGKTLYVVGHSLGGYISEAVASYCDVSGVSFNSPGPWHTTYVRNHTGHFRPPYEVHLTKDDPLSLLFPKPENSAHICRPIWHDGRNHKVCKPYMVKVEEMHDVSPNTLPIDNAVDQYETLAELFPPPSETDSLSE